MASKCRRLEGKSAIVTASTLGIGYAIAQRLLEEGANVLISSRKQKNVDAAVKALRARGLANVEGVVCHVCKADHREALVQRCVALWGKVDILVSNAAVQPAAGPTLDMSERAYDKIFDVNVKSYWQLVRDVRPHMPDGGAIVFVSSVAAYNPAPPLGLYSVSKTALVGLAKCLAVDLAPDNIRVNVLAPGLVKTKFSSALWQDEDMESQNAERAWLNRLGRPDEMSGAVAFLCSDDSSYMTGETMLVTGGMPARL